MRKISLIILFFLWAFYSPSGHLVYFTDKDFKNNDVIKASDFFVRDDQDYLDGFYAGDMWWGNPIEGQEVIDPIDGTPLIFASEYLVKVY